MVPKFRCWDEPNKTMRFNDEIVIWSGQVYINEKKKLDSIIKGYSCLPKHLMQSTGLKDKNGVDIFEGDIVAYDDYEFSYTAIVKKETYYFWLKGIEPDDAFHLEDISDEYDDTTDLTVIGNIYENPELLEVK